MLNIRNPYLLFLGDAEIIKTAVGIHHWRPNNCVGQMRLEGCPYDLGLPELTFADAVARGAKTLIVGAATIGGTVPKHWIGPLRRALEAGLDIACGLHAKLSDIPELCDTAAQLNRQLLDVRHPTEAFPIDQFERRSGKRLLTVGTDCNVGKMFTALAIEEAMRSKGLAVDFRATGQTGILIAGSGVSVDAVVSDFVSAASSSLSPANEAEHWDIIEGQGSLFHPAYAGVTLGLLHGSQPDALVLCVDPTRTTIDEWPLYPQPDLDDCLLAYARAAQLTNPDARCVGISFNTSTMSDAEANALLRRSEQQCGLPCVDPVRTGVARIVDRLLVER